MENTSSTPESPVSTDAFLLEAAIDQAALERVLEEQENTVNKYGGRTSTIASDSTPDYESEQSISDHETQKRKEWVRPGRLKTVGDVNMAAAQTRYGGAGRLDTYNKDLVEQAAEIPTVDFGPTLTYKPTTTSRPGTSGTITPGEFGQSRARSRSADRLRQSSGSRLSGYYVATPSPGENHRNSYFGGRMTPTGVDVFEQPSKRNSIAWTAPLSASPERAMRMQKRQTLSAEEWVQHRAALAALPQAPTRKSLVPTIAHQRHVSTSALPQRQSSKTPPPFYMQRPKSTDVLQMSRSHTPPNRPHSRGASAYLSNPGLVHSTSGATLSAKEQMHVARATGTKLVDLAANTKDKVGPELGLIAALSAREQERSNMHKGIRGGAVEQAIQARYQQEYEREARARVQMEHEAYQRRVQYEQTLQYQQMAFQRNMAAQQYRNSMHARSSSALGMFPPVQQGYVAARQAQNPSMMPQQQLQQTYGGYPHEPQVGQGQGQWPQQLPRR